MILLDEIEVGFEQKHRKEKEKVRRGISTFQLTRD